MYNFLSEVAPDYAIPLNLLAGSKLFRDRGRMNQSVRFFDDGSDHTITYSSSPFYKITIDVSVLTLVLASTIWDYYFDTDKAKGKARSFPLVHKDGYTYTVKFDTELEELVRDWEADKPNLNPMGTIIFRVLGLTP